MKNNYKQGEVWLARVFFMTGEQHKQRPVILVGKESAIDIDVLITPVTSQSTRNRFDVVLEYWQEAGLVKPSVARTSKITAIHGSELMRKLGSLNESDLEKVLQSCRELF